jgi:TetR/AcrR family fatty acid metabolism transcriptional regulator
MRASRSHRTKQEVIKDFRTAEILEAARRVIGEVGFADASMERIAVEAGVAKGTLYLYFKSKESLLARALEDGHAEMLARSRAAAQRVRGYREKLREVVREVVGYSAEHQAFYQALLDRPELSLERGSIAAQTLERNFEEYTRFVAGMLSRGTRSGEFRPVDPRRAAQFLFEIVRSLLRERFRERTPPDVDADVENIVDFYLHGVGAGGRE